MVKRNPLMFSSAALHLPPVLNIATDQKTPPNGWQFYIWLSILWSAVYGFRLWSSDTAR
jgi:hypothetical protein